jgi:hypothetical protein
VHSDAVGFGFADHLRADLTKSHQLILVDRLRLDALMREMRLASTGLADLTTAPGQAVSWGHVPS